MVDDRVFFECRKWGFLDSMLLALLLHAVLMQLVFSPYNNPIS